MENSHRFFANSSCKYFPCHSLPGEGEFNCLFCFCPLYSLGENCGGIFTMTDNGKCCMDCYLPHTPQHYDIIIEKLGEMARAPKPPAT